MKNEDQTIRSKFASSATVKAIVIGVLILMMMIPVMVVRQLIQEREYTGDSVTLDVSSKWGNRQTLTGPVICVPYKYVLAENNNKREVRDVACFLPEELELQTEIKPDTLYRSIYNVVVYRSEIRAAGKFRHPDFDKLNSKANVVDWQNAFVVVGISDLRGIRSNVVFNWDGTPKESMSGVGDSNVAESGITVKIPLAEKAEDDKTYSFDFTLTLNGSKGLFFVPAGKTTALSMSSPWNAPSFAGAFLPDERDVSSKGFTARWNVFSYNRNFPQMWTGSNANRLEAAQFGVNLILPVDHYQKTLRSVKYAIMFIALTFLVFFLVELISHKRIHPFQYLLVSIGLVLFYCLLLAFSEQMRFNLAYFISALAIVSLITAYSHSIFKAAKQTVLMGCLLIALYLFLFTVLQMEDFALLFGSVGLFVALAVVMYISRKVDWYRS